jgi:hypothetical protein
MDIDNNSMEKEAMNYFRENNHKEGTKLQNEFVKSVINSGQDYCSCRVDCQYHGKCVECVIIHRGHCEHLPNCFHNMVNDRIDSISSLTEHSFKDSLKK